MSTAVMRATFALLAALAIGILVASAWAGPSLDKCVRRCEKLYSEVPAPSPLPSRSPTPPTQTLGKACDYSITSARTITFPVGNEPTVLCIDPPAASTPFVEIATQNHGNASCADYWLQMYSPTGAVSEPSTGAQPGAIMARIPGRYYAVVYLRQANNAACSTLTVYVR